MGRVRAAGHPGRGSDFQGAEIAADVGLGAAVLRVSWAHYFEYDIGPEGWSIDALVVRPWVVPWGYQRDTVYVGVGGNMRMGPLRVGAGVLTPALRGDQLRPYVQAAVRVPLF